jgi:hypothetical protein
MPDNLGEYKLDAINDVAPLVTLTVKVERLPQWEARLRIGTWLIRLAALVMGVGLEIDMAGGKAEV